MYISILSLLTIILDTNIANAYFGLGPLIPLIGSAFWAFFAILVGILGVVIYPLKLLIKSFKRKKPKKND